MSATARAIAGGQSLGPMLNLRLARPERLVDIRRLPALRIVREDAAGATWGAATTHAEVEDGIAPDPTGGFLRGVARTIAYRAVRNRGTVGGSLAHADPAADWPVALALVEAVAETTAGRRIRGCLADPRALRDRAGRRASSCWPCTSRAPPPARAMRGTRSCRKTGEFAQAMAACGGGRKARAWCSARSTAAPRACWIGVAAARRRDRGPGAAGASPRHAGGLPRPRRGGGRAVTQVTLTVNGEAVTSRCRAAHPSRPTCLRETLGLTGTHLGCEHGVCGACTVEIDGAPSALLHRLCRRLRGRAVRTIEGFDDDPVMVALRDAFTAHHALQCGYCTPGMLIAARDLVLRLPDADEARVREEMSGNLCRCTGYRGIVRAILSVLEARRATSAG